MSRLVMTALILLTTLTAGSGFLVQTSAEEALLEATRPDTQKIPIHIMDFGNVDGAKRLGLNRHDEVARVLKADLTRSQVFFVVDRPPTKGTFSDNKCVGLSPVDGNGQEGAILSTWGRLGLGGSKSNSKGLVFDACADDTGQQDYLFGKRYFSMKKTEPLLRLMTHRWADELVYRYTGEQGIARTKIAYVAEEGLGKELFVMDYDGYGPQQVTADGYLNLMPTWAMDRRSLVFTAYRQ